LNVSDGETWANDTVEVIVRPVPRVIEYPTYNDEGYKTISSSGSTTGDDITEVEIKIGSKAWRDATPADDDDWSTWSYEWDTTNEDNKEFEIQVRAKTDYAVSEVVMITLTVNNPPELSVEFTSHSDSDSVKGTVTLRGTAAGENLQKVEIRIGTESYEEASDTSAAGDWSTWTYQWNSGILKILMIKNIPLLQE
jgi:hypothetical protein